MTFRKGTHEGENVLRMPTCFETQVTFKTYPFVISVYVKRQRDPRTSDHLSVQIKLFINQRLPGAVQILRIRKIPNVDLTHTYNRLVIIDLNHALQPK